MKITKRQISLALPPMIIAALDNIAESEASSRSEVAGIMLARGLAATGYQPVPVTQSGMEMETAQ